MNKKPYLALLLALAAGASFLLQACSDGGNDDPLPGGGGGVVQSVTATAVGSVAEVASGPPGAYYITPDRLRFHLRCPCGQCSKSNSLPLEPAVAPHVWQLTGPEGKPSLTPSIHWFETNGVTTHWHGWLRNGVFER